MSITRHWALALRGVPVCGSHMRSERNGTQDSHATEFSQRRTSNVTVPANQEVSKPHQLAAYGPKKSLLSPEAVLGQKSSEHPELAALTPSGPRRSSRSQSYLLGDENYVHLFVALVFLRARSYNAVVLTVSTTL